MGVCECKNSTHRYMCVEIYDGQLEKQIMTEGGNSFSENDNWYISD